MKNWLVFAIMAMSIGTVAEAGHKFETVSSVSLANNEYVSMEYSFVQRSSSGSFSSGSSSKKSSPSRSSTGSFGSSSKPSTKHVTPATPSRSSSGSFGSKSSGSSVKSAWSTSDKPKSSSSWGSTSQSNKVKQNVVVSNKGATSVDSRVLSSTKSSGKSYSSKENAIAAFKSSNAKETEKGGKFTAHYEKEPVSRPSHIPIMTTVGNTSTTISYNPQYGGYGYMHPTLGTWIMYDMLSDHAMMSTMSHNHGYYNGAGGGANPFYLVIGVIVIALILLFILGVRSAKA